MRKVTCFALLFSLGIAGACSTEDSVNKMPGADELDPTLIEDAQAALAEAVAETTICPTGKCAADVWGPQKPIFEGDGIVDIYDLVLVWVGADVFRTHGAYFAQLDLNCDNAVDDLDFWFVYERVGVCGVCLTNEDCSETTYCAADECGVPGMCEARPEACPDHYDPVCGCDGMTYGNSCDAAALGARVAFEGTCEGCKSNEDCWVTEYCAKDQCDDDRGQCEAREEYCPDHYDPVCGCDGVTYGNACDASALGANVAFEGECEACWSNEECTKDEYCASETCDAPGRCEMRPTDCMSRYEPVCGCDNSTYGNWCDAANMGMNTAYSGECK